MADYIHQESEQDVPLPAGYYTPLEEARFEHKGRQVLYVVGESTAETCCCASGRCGYALVPGYVLRWKIRKHKAGKLISEVEPIKDDESKQEIARTIREREGISNIKFW